MTYGQTIGLGNVIDVVGGDQASGARHVFHNYGGIAWNIFAHVAGGGAGVEIVAAAGRITHNDADGLAFVKGLLGRDGCARGEPNAYGYQYNPGFRLNSLLLLSGLIGLLTHKKEIVSRPKGFLPRRKCLPQFLTEGRMETTRFPVPYSR